jgi:hypothetical protein
VEGIRRGDSWKSRAGLLERFCNGKRRDREPCECESLVKTHGASHLRGIRADRIYGEWFDWGILRSYELCIIV